MRCAIQRLLHAGNDQHLVGGALHAARRIQIFGDRLAQRTVSQGLASGQQAGRKRAANAGRDLRPKRGGKNIERSLVGAKGPRDAWLAAADNPADAVRKTTSARAADRRLLPALVRATCSRSSGSTWLT